MESEPSIFETESLYLNKPCIKSALLKIGNIIIQRNNNQRIHSKDCRVLFGDILNDDETLYGLFLIINRDKYIIFDNFDNDTEKRDIERLLSEHPLLIESIQLIYNINTTDEQKRGHQELLKEVFRPRIDNGGKRRSMKSKRRQTKSSRRRVKKNKPKERSIKRRRKHRK